MSFTYAYTVASTCGNVVFVFPVNMLRRYIQRFDEELEEIRLAATLKGRQVRPHASREDALRMVREKEMGLLTGPGFGKNRMFFLSISHLL